MATAKKAAAKKSVSRPVAKKTKKVPVRASRKAPMSEADILAEADEEEDLEWMEVKKGPAKKAKKFPKLDLRPIKVPAKTIGKGKKAHKVKAKKLSPTQVINHVTEETGIARKDVKLILETLANTVKASIMPGGVGGAFIPGVGAVLRKDIKPRKIPAIARGTVVEKRNPSTGETTKWKHPGRKASVKPASSKARVILAASTRRAVFGTQ